MFILTEAKYSFLNRKINSLFVCFAISEKKKEHPYADMPNVCLVFEQFVSLAYLRDCYSSRF